MNSAGEHVGILKVIHYYKDIQTCVEFGENKCGKRVNGKCQIQ